MAYLAGRLPGRRTRLLGIADRQLLRDDGNRLAVHARRDGDYRRSLDSGAETAGHLPFHQRRVSHRRGLADGLRPAVQLHAAERDVLHADHRPVELRGLQCPRSGPARYREAFPAHPRMGNRGIHRRHVVRRPDAHRGRADQAHRVAALCFGPAVVRTGGLLVLAAGVSRRAQRAEAVVGRYAGLAGLRALQGEADGHFLRLLDAAGRRFADHQRLRRQLHSEFRLDAPVCRFGHREALGDPALAVADVRNALHSADSFLPPAFRH